MEHDAKIKQIAEILIDKHGHRALAVARRRAKDRLDHEDYVTALLWVQVTDVAAQLIAAPTRDPGQLLH
ncbi:MAG: hypothetical protein JO255_18635 [Alphaproteobacteria bacterium]|nr:hypothetical protein [Alphaproteobacteria bacterium]